MRRLADFTRSTMPSNGMDAKSSAGALLSSPAAAKRGAKGAGLDSGALAEAQSAMPSIALLCRVTHCRSLSTKAAPSVAPQLQSRISTSLTDVTIGDLDEGVPEPLQKSAANALIAVYMARTDRQQWHPPSIHKGVGVRSQWLEIMTMTTTVKSVNQPIVCESIKPDTSSHSSKQNEQLA